MKKLLLPVLLFIIILVAIVNYRTPFLKQAGGPWSIGFGSSDVFPEDISVEKNAIYPFEEVKKINDSTQFTADPFFLKVKDTFYLFFEHKKTGPHAEIGLLTSADGKNYKYRGTVLKEKFHLSYPQVFHYKNNYYMIPESKGGRGVYLYKAAHFPFGWKVCDTLLKNVKLTDPSIYLSDTLNIMVASDENLNLLMYQADSLFGKWKLHKKPKVLMGSEARAGGRFFADAKGLLLPVQNRSNGYGYGLSLYRLSFKNGDYKIKRQKPFFLKGQEHIKEFNAGMHQFDMQHIDGKYYYVYDGNRLLNNNKKWNIIGAFKMNYCDLINWFKLTTN